MSIDIRPYEERYRVEVISCLRRNYRWMGDTTSEIVQKWLSPIVSYEWSNMKNVGDIPFNYGAVLLYGKNVVGFFGSIYAERNDGKKKYIVLNCSTWCIDEGYRMYLSVALKMLFRYADVITEFTPRKSVEEYLANIYRFNYLGRETVRLYPVPLLESNYIIHIDFSDDGWKIEQCSLLDLYHDHKKYDVKVAHFSIGDDHGYVFYKKMNYRGEWLLILKIDNPRLFAQHAHEIIWRLQRKEQYSTYRSRDEVYTSLLKTAYQGKWLATECDKFLLRGLRIKYPCWKIHPVARMILDKSHVVGTENHDFLYSEISMLSMMG